MKNKKFTARKRYLSKTQDKGKGKSVVLEEDGDNDDDYVAEMDEQEDETDDDSGYVEEEDEEEWPCSDTELADMRRMRAQLREENDALEKSQSQARRDSLKGLSGQRNDSSLLKEPIYNNELEEEEDYAYAEPAVAQKHKAGAHEVFNRRRCNSSTTNDEKTEGEAQKTKEKGRLGRCS
nr:PREDICTED: nucleoplasmin-like protein ANO39 [Daucus carota subsp. sativus]